MKKLKFERTIIITILFSFLTIICGLIFSGIIKNSYIHSEIENFKTVNDIKKADINIEYVEDAIFTDDVLDIIQDAPLILIVKPTGNILQARGSFNQEVEIISNMNSNDTRFIKGEKINVFLGYYYFNFMGENLIFRNSNNILMPENTYLLFLQEDELNKYSGNKNCRLYGQYTSFSSINLNRTNKQEVCTNYKFNELSTTDNFASSQEVLNSIIETENSILEKYSKFVSKEIEKY